MKINVVLKLYFQRYQNVTQEGSLFLLSDLFMTIFCS